MAEARWSLEIVRGREVGRRFVLVNAETILGNAPGVSGIDLAAQEPDAPRRMAARQAAIRVSAGSITVVDLQSPGGTFVNRRRVLSGESRALSNDDLIQIGAVQLRLVAEGVVAHGEGLSDRPFAFEVVPGVVCRCWDDFLRVSARRWGDVREAITSGRIDAWLRTIGRADLIAAPAPPDDRLDTWIGQIPTTLPARPEIDIHPTRLVVKASPGGGIVSRSVRVMNIGHRVLHVRASVEPASTTWVRLDPATDGRMLAVVDPVDLKVEFAIPEATFAPLSSTLVLDGDGGHRRVELLLEPRAPAPSGVAGVPAANVRRTSSTIGRVPVPTRLAGLALAAVVVRAGVAAVDRGMVVNGPSLAGPVAVSGLVVALVAGSLMARRGGVSGASVGAVSGGIAGACMAALAVAACRTFEARLGELAESWAAVLTLWAGLGVALGALSAGFAPYDQGSGVDR